MKKRIMTILCSVLVVTLLLAGCGGNTVTTPTSAPANTSSGATTTPGSTTAPTTANTVPAGWVKVTSFQLAAVNHLTGATALSGTLRKNGYELAKEEVNAAGGINGLPIEIIYEDDQSTNQGAVSATQKVLQQYKALALMIDRSTMVNAVHTIVQDAGIPTFFGASAASINDLKNPWFFRMRVDDAANAGVVAKFMVDNLKKTKIAALYAADTFGEGGNTETKKALKEKYNMTPVAEQKYTSGTKDFTAQLLAIKSAGADMIYAWGTNSEDNAIILRQFKQLGLDKSMDFIGSAAYASAVTIDLAKENINGIYSINDFAPDDTRPQLQAWLKAYQTKYSGDPDFWCLSTYDIVKLIADAAKRGELVKKVGNDYYVPDLAAARTALAKAVRETTSFAGAAGEYAADKYQNMIHNQAVVKIEGGKLKLIEMVKMELPK